MIIIREAITPKKQISIAQLRASCLGCEDCKGVCNDLVYLQFLPDTLAERREKN